MAKDRSSRQAVGTIETDGFPPVLAAADAMLKAGRVTLVGYLRAGSARFTVNVRGDVSEVKQAMAAGIDVVEKVRSEERRVGKECLCWCISRWSPYH